jgi:4-hydroxy-2-oxoheptanedioate aldolase
LRINRVKRKINSDEKVYGIIFTFPCPQAVEIVGNLGFDFIFIEGEHGSWTLKDIEETCILANAMGLTVHARVPNILPSTILQFLDRGVQGITGPHIHNKSDTEALVSACRFAPLGKRSFFPSRPAQYNFPKDVSAYMNRSNEEIWVTALLEDREAIEENLSEILSVKGIDSVSIGYVDLSQSMGEPGNWEHPKVAKAMEKAWEEIIAAGKGKHRELMFSKRLTDMIIEGCKRFSENVRG